MNRGASSFALMATEDRSKIASRIKKKSHPYARKGALHTFTSSRAGGALHAISVPLIAPKCAAAGSKKKDCTRPADGSRSKVAGKSRRSRGSVRLYSTEDESEDLPARLPARRRRRLFFLKRRIISNRKHRVWKSPPRWRRLPLPTPAEPFPAQGGSLPQ